MATWWLPWNKCNPPAILKWFFHAMPTPALHYFYDKFLMMFINFLSPEKSRMQNLVGLCAVVWFWSKPEEIKDCSLLQLPTAIFLWRMIIKGVRIFIIFQIFPSLVFSITPLEILLDKHQKPNPCIQNNYQIPISSVLRNNWYSHVSYYERQTLTLIPIITFQCILS